MDTLKEKWGIGNLLVDVEVVEKMNEVHNAKSTNMTPQIIERGYVRLYIRFYYFQLENQFQTSHYPDVVQRELLAKRINLKEERIEVRILFSFLPIIYSEMRRFGSKIDGPSGENNKEKPKTSSRDD